MTPLQEEVPLSPTSTKVTSFGDRLDLLQTSKTIFQLLVCIILPILFVYNVEIQSSLDSTIPKPTMTTLPPPNQTWAHAVDSRQALMEALQDDNITAIETDLVMGTIAGSESRELSPIMAHPPKNQSDLSMTDFLHLVSNHSQFDQPTLRKVIKLDFKQYEAVEPTLKAIAQMQINTPGDHIFVLNADILPGPGGRGKGAVTIGATPFIETVLPHLSTAQSATRIAFSLGYKTAAEDLKGYTAADVEAMAWVISEYKLVQYGVVVALNARQLAKTLTLYDEFMAQYPEVQILVWTGKGEPPIPQPLLQSIKDHFREKGLCHRIGFDCQVTTNRLVGKSVELGMKSIGWVKSTFSSGC